MAALTPNIRLAPIVIPWMALLVVGTIMVGSAAVALGGGHLSKHMIFLAVACVTSIIVFAIPPVVWNRLYLLGWLASVVIAVLVLVPGIGTEVNGAQRWVRFGGFSIQAAELAKFGLCIYMAGYLSRHHERLSSDPLVLFVPLLMVGFVCGLIVAQPDLGSAVVIIGATTAVLFIAGAKLRYFLIILVAGAGALAALIAVTPWRVERLIAFLDPWSVQFGSGYQLTQALIAFGRGEMFGLGLGEGVQKLYYLPEAHNDFIFAVVAEELGGVGAILLALLLSYLVFQLLAVARRNIQRRATFAGIAGYFTAFVIGIQFLVNLGVNTGVLPTKGLTLPFISYGGNSLIVCCAMLALVLRCTLDREATRV